MALDRRNPSLSKAAISLQANMSLQGNLLVARIADDSHIRFQNRPAQSEGPHVAMSERLCSLF